MGDSLNRTTRGPPFPVAEKPPDARIDPEQLNLIEPLIRLIDN